METKTVKKLKCNICGYITTDILNKGGHASKHLRIKHDIDTKEIQSHYTTIDETVDIFKCPYCDWDTVDLDNKSGMFTSHLEKVHGITPSQHVLKYPDHKKLWKMFFIRKDREDFVNSSTDNQIKCEICGKVMLKLSNTHLQKHGITPDEYKIKYNISTTTSKHTSNKQSEITTKHNIRMMQYYKENNIPMPWHTPEIYDQKVLENFESFKKRYENDFSILSDVQTYRNNEPLEIKCKKCGTVHINEYRVLRCYTCDPLLNGKSKEEKELVEYLENDLKVTVEIGNRSIIKPQELDIYLPDYKIAIEFDGLYWHSELNNIGKNYHLNKTESCEQLGIQLIHIFEDEWLIRKDIVKTRIRHILGLSEKRLYARDCIIREITPKEKNEFLNKYHIQGSDMSKIKLGAYYDDDLIAVMTFGSLRVNMNSKPEKDVYELLRFASKCTVIGIADKFIKYFINHYNPIKIITYADRRWTKSWDNVYEKIGFTKISNGSPNYWYMDKKLQRREYRYNYTKSNIVKKLGGDPLLSEAENMKYLGYTRIWDCGNLKYELLVK